MPSTGGQPGTQLSGGELNGETRQLVNGSSPDLYWDWQGEYGYDIFGQQTYIIYTNRSFWEPDLTGFSRGLESGADLIKDVVKQTMSWANKQNTCTGLVGQAMSDLYNAGDTTAKLGGGMVVYAGILQAGDVTPAAPVTITGGLTIGGAGTLGVIVGTAAKGAAGAWYAFHGNPYPVMNTLASVGFMAAGDSPSNAVLESGLSAEGEAAEQGSVPECHP